MQTTTHMPIELGTNVYGSDGEKIGSVAETQNQYFVIEKGFIFTTDIYIPMSAVVGRDEDGIRLSMTKDEIDHGDWSSPPVLGDQTNAGEVGYAGQHDTGWDAGTGSVSGDSDVLERREERLTVDKQAEQAGSVRVGKHVVSDEQSVDVPVTREEVTINRRSVDRP